MAKRKNYLSNEELKEELLKCINAGFEKAVSNGFSVDLDSSESDVLIITDDYEKLYELGYNPERTLWIKALREFDPEELQDMVNDGEISERTAYMITKQMEKPIVSEKLGKMFQLIVENVARSFYWSNPDDGLDCKANALLDLCSNFWKFEPVDSKGKVYNAFAFCTQISYFGIAGAHRILHPKKYDGTISMSCLDDNGKSFDIYNI